VTVEVGFVWWLYDNLKWCIIGVEIEIETRERMLAYLFECLNMKSICGNALILLKSAVYRATSIIKPGPIF
jgi:hypothetical protein